uniref:HDGF like 2 n=1 Tax=Poecilia reticulata TaxID=8081 RepID=A0A3P9P8U0_POERE
MNVNLKQLNSFPPTAYSDSEPDRISEWKKRDEERRRELEERRKKEEAEELRRLREREKEEDEKKKKDKEKSKKETDSDSSSSSDEGVDDHPLKKSKKPPPPPIPAPSDSDSPSPAEVKESQTGGGEVQSEVSGQRGNRPQNANPEKPKRRPERPPEKKVEKKKEPSPEERLQKLHTDIKFALKVDNPDIERCLKALEELEAVPVTSQILHKNAEVIATLKKIRRYKASAAVMEKASDVYNKLKLRFVGKPELAAKPKIENKETENDEKQSQNTESKPVNGESEERKENAEEDEKPKSPLKEENNDGQGSSPNRPSSDSPAPQQTPTYEEADGTVSAEPEPAAVET